VKLLAIPTPAPTPSVAQQLARLMKIQRGLEKKYSCPAEFVPLTGFKSFRALSACCIGDKAVKLMRLSQSLMKCADADGFKTKSDEVMLQFLRNAAFANQMVCSTQSNAT
jgi:hypothetical protein